MNLCNIHDIKALLARHGFRFSKTMGQNFLIEPWVPEEIAAAIRSLLDDPERRAAMGERGYGALQTRFNWQTEEKKLLALYEELLSLKGE